MSERPPAKSAAERKRAQRQRMHERGAPSIPTFDAALRAEAFALYQAGEPVVQLPDLVQAATAR